MNKNELCKVKTDIMAEEEKQKNPTPFILQ